MSSRSKSRPSSTGGKTPKTRTKAPCDCCRKFRKDGVGCIGQPAELHGCLRCDQEVCKRCLSQGLCYMCRLKGSDNLNNEASLKRLKKQNLKVIVKKLGCKKEGEKHVSEEQMIAEIVQRCNLNGETPEPSSSLKKKDNAIRTSSQSAEKSTPTPAKENKQGEDQAVKKTSGNFPLLVNVKNEEEIKKLSIPQLRELLKYYNKYDETMIERREFVEAAINLWKTEMNIPLDYVEDQRKQEEPQKPGTAIQINGIQQESNQSEPSGAGSHRKESFVLPPESPGSFHEFEKNILEKQRNSSKVHHQAEAVNGQNLEIPSNNKGPEPIDTIPPDHCEIIKPEVTVNGQNQEPPEIPPQIPEIIVEKRQPPKIPPRNPEIIEKQEPPEIPPQIPEAIVEKQEPVEAPWTMVTPTATLTELPPTADEDDDDDDDGSGGSSSDDEKSSESSGSSAYDSSVEQQEEVANNDHLSEDMVHAANLNRKPKAILTELSPRHSRELQQETDGNTYYNGQQQYNVEDFETYANLESFRGIKPDDLHIDGHQAAYLNQMLGESVEASDSFVYLTPIEETTTDHSLAQRPSSLPLKATPKRVGFKPLPDHICDEEQSECSVSSSRDDLVEVKEAEIPITPEQLLDTLQEMEDSMVETTEFPDFEKVYRKRLSSDKVMTYHDDIDHDGTHTPEEFLETVQGIKSNLENGNSANISVAVEKLLEYAYPDGDVGSGQDNVSGDSGQDAVSGGSGQEAATGGSSVHWKDATTEIESKQSIRAKFLDLPLIGSVVDSSRSKVQRPESWGISMDEILTEESIKNLTPHQLQLLLQKHGINLEMFQGDQNEMVQEVTKLWLATRNNRISMYEEAISEDESEGNISLNTEFEITSLPADLKIVEVVMKGEHSKTEDLVELRHVTDSSEEKSSRLSEAKDDLEKSIQKYLNEDTVEQRVHKSKIPIPTKTVRPSTTSAYLMYTKSEDEIEQMEEYKLRAILRQANISRKDIWIRDDLIEEVKKLWNEEQSRNAWLSQDRRSSSTLSLREFGSLRTSSRKASTDSLLLDIEFDSIQSEKDLENLTSRNLQNLLEKSGVSIRGLILREHFLRTAIKHWRQLQGIPVRRSQLPVRISTVLEKPELLLENIHSEDEIEKLPIKVIREILDKHGLPVKLDDQNPDLILRLKMLWRTQKSQDDQPIEALTPMAEVRTNAEMDPQTNGQDVRHIEAPTPVAQMRTNAEMDQDNNGQEMNPNGHSGASSPIVQQETTNEDGSTRNSQQGPPKPLRLAQIHSLEEITSPDSIRRMEVKQIKSILNQHSVSYADCQEKHEIVERLEVLWRDKNKQDSLEIRDEDLCKVCLSDRVDCVLLECGHMTTCTACGNKIKECPICRNYVVKVVHLYKA